MLYLVVRALERGPAVVREVLERPRTLELFWRSSILALTVTVACIILGSVLAWIVVRTDLRGRRILGVLFTLPLAIPSYVLGFIWVAELPQLTGFIGAATVLTIASYPYVFLPVAAALAAADPAGEEVAQTLGRSRIRAVLSITTRQVWPAATAGGLLVALYTLSDFGAVALMRYDAFTVAIFMSYQGSFDRTPAAILGLILAAAAILLTIAERRARRGFAARIATGAPRASRPFVLGPLGVPAYLLAVTVITAGVILPFAALGRWMLRSQRVSVAWGEIWAATASTIQVAGIAALATTLAAIPIGLLAARSRSLAARTAESVSYIGFALPGITVGLAVVFIGIRALPQLYQQLPMLVMAYMVLFLPLAVGAIRSAIASIPESLEDVSATLGEPRWRTSIRIVLPLALPGTAAGAALVFLAVAKELPATLMLRPTTVDTLATSLWSHTAELAYGAAAPYAVALILVAALPALLLGNVMGWRSTMPRLPLPRDTDGLDEAAAPVATKESAPA
ncbi:iron ABC transporter permease [Hoyosella sp. G463]|uniref:Iron ABC transporter permease n=1 Tax=Lolliginicoccus lacisalsi TaxID=2742202 RepID=A0A927PMM4_9ACTN|nr:iron ABC transporter permease [Lolliginicoccus lacisalsi]MBD8506556.1 iron ABC transporter permease [Lolliginicoccus lacisalsi]